MPHPVHTGHTGFSEIEIKARIGSGVADNAVVLYAFRFTVACFKCFVANPVKPAAVGVTQAARLAMVQSRDGGLWCDVQDLRRRPFLEPHERVIASRSSYTDHRPHTHIQIYHHIDCSLALYRTRNNKLTINISGLSNQLVLIRLPLKNTILTHRVSGGAVLGFYTVSQVPIKSRP